MTFERDEQGKYWATLANYQRFQGGRRANAEVHGGATLEEILIPVLIIYKKLNTREIYFINPVIELSRDKIAVLKIYSSQPMENPRLRIENENKFYTGELAQDRRYAEFKLSDLKRSKIFQAEIYDGAECIKTGLTFSIRKKMARENNLGL